MNSIDKQMITGLILAGGRGTRMGQVDKGLQAFRGKAMVHHVLTRLAPQTGAMMINANQNLAIYQNYGVPVWPDLIDGYAGPLAGMHSGMQHCTTPYLACAPCDSPLLPENLVERLSSALVETGSELAVAVTMETGKDGEARRQSHPVFALMHVALLPKLTKFLQQGGRKVDAWFADLKVVEVLFENKTAFRNINTLQELKELES
ncbi:MAG: molybdenum cofactor guanylyltransferase MobA [Burkholderiales bacterium]|nr:molybdenum cofactor guanylyltransferase MobA [Burkholderiales bacterium]